MKTTVFLIFAFFLAITPGFLQAQDSTHAVPDFAMYPNNPATVSDLDGDIENYTVLFHMTNCKKCTNGRDCKTLTSLLNHKAEDKGLEEGLDYRYSDKAEEIKSRRINRNNFFAGAPYQWATYSFYNRNFRGQYRVRGYY